MASRRAAAPPARPAGALTPLASCRGPLPPINLTARDRPVVRTGLVIVLSNHSSPRWHALGAAGGGACAGCGCREGTARSRPARAAWGPARHWLRCSQWRGPWWPWGSTPVVRRGGAKSSRDRARDVGALYMAAHRAGARQSRDETRRSARWRRGLVYRERGTAAGAWSGLLRRTGGRSAQAAGR